MSLEQYKDKTRQELLVIMDIQAEEYQRLLSDSDKSIAELENALATSFEFLSLSRPLDNLFYENRKHLIEEQGE